MDFFEIKNDIYVIVRSNKNTITELVYASGDKEEIINKLIELRLKQNSNALETEDFSRIEDGFVIDEYSVMAFKDNKFEKTSL
jgi:NCAIR mutase (PurE)-related protein